MKISGLTIDGRHRPCDPRDRPYRMDAVGEHISPGYARLVRSTYRNLRKNGVGKFTARVAITNMLNAGYNAGARKHNGDIP